MARFSQAFLQGLLQPTYQQGLFEAARGLGQTPGIMRMQQQRKASQAEIQRLLQENISNPEKLQQLENQYRAQGNEAAAKAFAAAATQATAKATEKKTALQEKGELALFNMARMMQASPSEDISRNDLKRQSYFETARGYGVSPERAMEILEQSVTKKTEGFTLPAGSIRYEPDPTSPTGYSEVGRAPFKTETASKGIKTVERKDGSLTVLDADDGSVIQTLPAPGKGKGDRDSALNLIAQTTGFIQEIDNLMDPGFMETGFIGGVTAAVPGTPAYDREKELLSIRARLGFDQINEMKRLAAESGASGTGLGQISNIEFMSLQSTIDAIYTGMSGEAQNEALANIKKHLLNVQKLASGVAPVDAIEWDKPEYKAVGYHKDPETGTVFYAPDGPNGTIYKLVDGEFVKIGA